MILAGGFSQFLGGTGDIEDIIHDLKRQADVAAVRAQSFHLPRVRCPGQTAAASAGGQERSRLGAMNIFQSFRADVLPFGLQIHHLASDHPVDCACGVGDLPDNRQARRAGNIGQFRQNLITTSHERIAREDRHGLAKNFVARGHPSAQIVIVQRRKIVVDERVCVNHFDGARKRQQHSSSASHTLPGSQNKNGPDPLASRKHGITHSTVNRRGFLRFLG